jgi:hypothetical protein
VVGKRFERVGRRVDKEIDRVIRVLDKQVRPAAEKRSIQLLRHAARALDMLAGTVERSRSGRKRGRKRSR